VYDKEIGTEAELAAEDKSSQAATKAAAQLAAKPVATDARVAAGVDATTRALESLQLQQKR
jgi:hypothetical protein